jgi:hypothetical protein
MKESEMSKFEKETLADLSKVIRLQADRPLHPDTVWMKIENAAMVAVVAFLATWWIATIIRL